MATRKSDLAISQPGLRDSLGLPAPGDQAWPANETGNASSDIILKVPLSTHRRGQQMKLAMNGAAHKVSPDRSLLAAVARARTWADRLITGDAETITQIAAEEGVTDGYVGRILPLAFLAPTLVEDILLGQQTPELTADRLAWRAELSMFWPIRSVEATD